MTQDTPRTTTSAPVAIEGEAELVALRKALSSLVAACRQADNMGELCDAIDGSLIDAADNALELQYPVIWTDEQVAELNAHQERGDVHPYTCGGDRSDAAHVYQADDACARDRGVLIATPRGWMCPACDYRQFWAHGVENLPTPPTLPEGVVPVVQGDSPEDYVRYADAMLERLFWPNGTNRDDAKPYIIARNLALAVKVLAGHRLPFSDNAEGMRVEGHRFVRHADGGVYAVQGERLGKIGDGIWHPGFDYLCLASGMQFWTDRARFDERFVGLAWTQATEDLLAEKHAALNSPGSPKP